MTGPTGSARPPSVQVNFIECEELSGHDRKCWGGQGAPGAFNPIMSLKLSILLCPLATSLAAAGAVSFNEQVRPLLANNCFHCHGPDEAERKGGPKGSGGLRLDTAEGALMDLGGSRAIVPGKPEESEILKRMKSHDPDDVMPPPESGKKLSAAEIQVVSDWIAAGASYAKHWSYERPVQSELPRPGEHPVDAFVSDRLAREGLALQTEADCATLIRRVTLDLTGLPPSPEEVDYFVRDPRPDAWERLLDRLLASPAYGEHWARQWLDLARYADSAGYADDPPRTIWAYRDWVVKSFKANQPFDQFTIEQLAGDLLPGATEDQLVATAFHRNTMTNSEGGTNDEEFRNAAIVDRVNTTFSVWMGTSMACAQCHTHKYDPITQHEYFQLFAFFNNTADNDQRDEAPLLSVLTADQRKQKEALERKVKELEASLENPAETVVKAAAAWAATFQHPVPWQPAAPASVQSASGVPVDKTSDGTVVVSKPAAKDTVTVSLPAPESLAALRLEALPHESLPGGGPGHAGGNFVVTGIRVAVKPPGEAKPPMGRYVRIELPGEGRLLQLAEVEVFSAGANVAPRGKASQKSTFADAGASRANDGRSDPEYNKGSVAHSGENTPDPWWEVDLGSELPLDRVVVWNRAEAAERLNGFRMVVLDGERKPVWEKSDNPAAASIPFALTGEREIRFTDAAADYEQPEFSAESLVRAAPQPKRGRRSRGPQQGWAIGGSPGKAHELILTVDDPVAIPPGSTLTVSIEQQSPHANHTVGRFRLSTSVDPRAAALASVPSALRDVLATPSVSRTAEQQKLLVSHYAKEVGAETATVRDELAAVRKEMAAFQPVTVPVMRELPAGQRRRTQLQLRGNYLSKGDEVSEGVPAVFAPLPDGAPRDRLALARWIVSPENPMTARVIVNRFWESIFGIGLVRTSEEFGSQGDLPTHPELLDWLAVEFVKSGWDVKKFLRLLTTSATYRQSSRVAPGMAERDPDNRLLARGPRVRLSGEMVRDQALAVSGLLSRKQEGPPVRPPRPAMGLSAAFGGGLDWQTSAGEDRYRRALYTEWRRTSPYPSLTTFDAPSREVCTIRRNQTNTPLQALVTLNDPVFVEAAQAMARRFAVAGKEPGEIVHAAFRHALSRDPSERERSRLVALHTEALASLRADPKRAADLAGTPLPEGRDAADMAAWTAVSNVILNLDELLMKR